MGNNNCATLTRKLKPNSGSTKNFGAMTLVMTSTTTKSVMKESRYLYRWSLLNNAKKLCFSIVEFIV